MDEVVVWASAVQFTATSEPPPPRGTRRLKVSPCLFIAVFALCIRQVGRAYLI